MNTWYKFFYIIRYLFDRLNISINSYYFLLNSFNLLNLFLNINFRNLFKLSLFLNDDFLLYLRNNLCLSLQIIFLNNFLYNLSYWFNMYSLCIYVNRYSFLQINWNRTLNRLINYFLYKLYFFLFIWNSYNFINMHLYWNLMPFNYNTLFLNLLYFNISTSFNIFHHDLIWRYLNWTINCDINYFLTLYFFWYLNIHILWNVMNFRRHIYRYLNNFFYYFLQNLWNFNYFLNYSWNNNNLFYNFLDLYEFRYLD